MNKLKPLLLRIASLPLSDQRWIIRQLTPKQKRLFVQHKATSLLNTARRFAKLPIPKLKIAEPTLPHFCKELNHQPPLYVAIILEQGAFPWEELFLAHYTQHHNLSAWPIDGIEQLKPATKAALFNQWKAQLHFEDLLEVGNGTNN